MKKRLFAMIVAVTMMVSILPSTAMAEDLVGLLPEDVDDTQFDSVGLSETEEGEAKSLPKPSDGVITLAENVTLTESWEVAAETTITLDLKGFTLSVSGNAAVVKNYGELTIKDTSEEQDGKITGYRGVDNYGTLTLNSGTIHGTSSDFATIQFCASASADTASFTMKGGTVTSVGANAIGFTNNTFPASTTITLEGGTVGGILLKGNTTLTVGESSVPLNHSKIAVGAITTFPNNTHAHTLNLYSGIIEKLPSRGWSAPTVTYAATTALIVDDSVCPDGYHFDPVNFQGKSYHQLKENNLAVAKLCSKEGAEEEEYYSVLDAVDDLEDGDTLKLLTDYTITYSSQAINIKVPNVTLDLNGHGIISSASTSPVRCSGAASGTFTITNSSETESSSITTDADNQYEYAIAAVSASSNTSVTVEIGDNVTVGSVRLSSGARMEDTEPNRALVAVDGSYDNLYAVTLGDKKYIYGGSDLSAIGIDAKEAGITEVTATLLGNATNGISYGNSNNVALTVDLGGHVVTGTGNTAVGIPSGHNGTSLTVRNGTVHGAISAAGASSENCTLTLEKLNMTSNGDTGVGANGEQSDGLKLTLTDCTLTSTNDNNMTTGIFFPVANGELTIENSTITGYNTGVQAYAGSVTISGENTVITGSGVSVPNLDKHGNPLATGPIFDGSAVSIIDRNTDYGDLTSIQIKDGSFRTDVSNAANGAVHVATEVADNPGTFEKFDNTSSDGSDKTVQVSGGTFSSPIAPELCETGRAPLVKADGSCSIIIPSEGGSQEGYIEQDGTYYENEQALTVTHVAKVGDSYYSTLAEAISEAKNGETVTLLKSTTGNTSVSISDGRSITLDMNGFDAGFSFKNNISVFHGGLNIVGSGKLYEESPWFAPVMLYGSDYPADSDYTTVIVGEEVTLEGWAGLFIDQLESNSSGANAFGIVATVNGTLNSKKDSNGDGGHALYINGTIKATEGNVPKIMLNGATLTTELGNGIYLAGYAETTIIDSSITSTGEDSTGIEIRAGKLSISGNTKIEASIGEVEVTPNGNGSTSANVAIAVAQHTTKLPIEVTVTGGTFIGGAALNEMNPQGNEHVAINQVEISVEGGNFVGIVNSEDISGFVAGGNFSDPVNRKYLDDTLNAELKRSSGKTPYSYYTDVDEALACAGPGDQITDLSDQSGEPSDPVTVVTVTYSIGGHGTAPESEKVFAGAKIKLPKMDNEEGYAFRGWLLNGETYQPGEMFQVDESVTFTAQWERLVSGILLDKTILTLYEGERYALTATVMPEDAVDKTVTWNSSNPMIATVDEDGVVTAIRDGSATITATTSNGMSDTCEVIIVERPSRPSRPSGGSSEPSYTVSVEDLVNGTVETDPRRAQEGEEVTITVTPDDGYELDTLTVTDRDGDEVEVTEERNGTFTFTMPDSRVTIEATFVPVEEDVAPEIPTGWSNPYGDVAANAWYYDAVAYVTANGLMNGTSATTFAPNATTTRAMIWTVLARMNGQNVDGGTPWYAMAQSWAMTANVSDGTNPGNPISREELATMLYRAAGSPAVSGNLLSYPDGNAVSAWAENAMLWATQNGIISGIDGMLAPQGQATRAQVATMLMRFREVVIH